MLKPEETEMKHKNFGPDFSASLTKQIEFLLQHYQNKSNKVAFSESLIPSSQFTKLSIKNL